jgi:hypothetical protein
MSSRDQLFSLNIFFGDITLSDQLLRTSSVEKEAL